jgi:hypothetical protein
MGLEPTTTGITIHTAQGCAFNSSGMFSKFGESQFEMLASSAYVELVILTSIPTTIYSPFL